MPSASGKIRGDGRKFLDRFKSYFGLQISSQSLKLMRSISTNYSRNPQQMVSFSHVFVFDCFELASWIANGEMANGES